MPLFWENVFFLSAAFFVFASYSCRRTRYLKPLLFLSLLSATFVVFRYSLPAIPSADQLLFLDEQQFSKSSLDFFIRSLSFNRTRVLHPDNFSLFRPGLTGLLAYQEIFSGTNYWFQGIVSFCLHAAAAFLLLVTIKKYVSLPVALLGVIVFLPQYVGMEIVTWRHITFYLLSLLFYILGIWVVVPFLAHERLLGKRVATLTALCFFFSGLFHEATILAILLLLPFFLLIRRDRGLTMALGVPAISYLGLSAISYVYYMANLQVLGPSDRAFSVFSVIPNVIKVTGYFVFCFVFPSLIHLKVTGTNELLHVAGGRLGWTSGSYGSAYWALGVAGIFLLILVARKAIKITLSINPNSVAFFCLFLLAYLFALILGLSVGRASARSFDYLELANYYCYLFNFTFILLLCFAPALFPRLAPSKNGLLVAAVVGFSFFFIQYQGIQRVLKPISGWSYAVADTTYRLGVYLKAHPEFCLGGVATAELEDFLCPQSFYLLNCAQRKTSALYFERKKDEFFLTSALSPNHSPIPIPLLADFLGARRVLKK